MFGLTRWSPLELHREVDDLFNRFFGNAWPWRLDQGDSTPTWRPAVKSYTDNGTLCIRVALPGVDPKDVEVSVGDGTLTVSGTRKAARESADGNYYQRELAYGKFERTFEIPEGVDAGQVKAKYGHGMLEIRMPAPLQAAPKKIEIQVDGEASERKQIKA